MLGYRVWAEDCGDEKFESLLLERGIESSKRSFARSFSNTSTSTSSTNHLYEPVQYHMIPLQGTIGFIRSGPF